MSDNGYPIKSHCYSLPCTTTPHRLVLTCVEILRFLFRRLRCHNTLSTASFDGNSRTTKVASNQTRLLICILRFLHLNISIAQFFQNRLKRFILLPLIFVFLDDLLGALFKLLLLPLFQLQLCLQDVSLVYCSLVHDGYLFNSTF